MRATTISFGDDVWAMLAAEADELGISTAQLVRDAALTRLAALAARSAERHARAPERLAALRRTSLLDTPAEEAFDRLARLAATLLAAPVVLVSLIDADRQFFKSCIGLGEPWASERETPLSQTVCQHTLRSTEPLVLGDARRDPRLRDNATLRELGVVAYLGAPLVTRDGHALGTLCAIDVRRRDWTSDEVSTLVDLAATVVGEIELRTPLGAS